MRSNTRADGQEALGLRKRDGAGLSFAFQKNVPHKLQELPDTVLRLLLLPSAEKRGRVTGVWVMGGTALGESTANAPAGTIVAAETMAARRANSRREMELLLLPFMKAPVPANGNLKSKEGS